MSEVRLLSLRLQGKVPSIVEGAFAISSASSNRKNCVPEFPSNPNSLVLLSNVDCISSPIPRSSMLL